MRLNEVMKGRKAMYAFLGNIFLNNPPLQFLRDVYEGEEIPLPPHSEIIEGIKAIREYASKFENFEEFVREVKAEYAELFAGPEAKILPYQSAYEGENPYGYVTLRIRDWFFKAGYELKLNEAADHIGVELLFMAELSSKEGLRIQAEFLENELLKWVFSFCKDLERYSKFYGGIAKILRGFIKMEKVVIKKLLSF